MAEQGIDQLYKDLGEPFPKAALKQREVDGKWFTYVDGTAVIRRLNHIAPGWSNKIVGPIIRTPHGKTRNGADKELLMAAVSVTIPGLGTREHIGVQVVVVGGGEDLFKGVITDGIKKAATLFGVALDLYGPDYEDYDEPQTAARATRPAAPPPYRPTAADVSNGQTPRPASEPSRHMLYGLTKQLGQIFQHPDGSNHHDEAWLMQEAYERFEDPNIMGSEYLSQAQVSELIDDFKSRVAPREQEQDQRVSPSAYQTVDQRKNGVIPADIHDWNQFWKFCKSQGVGTPAEYERIVGRKQSTMSPTEAQQALIAAFASPHLTRNVVG